MDTNTTITVGVTIFVAILGSVAAYLNSLRIAARKDQLDHVDRQLRKPTARCSRSTRREIAGGVRRIPAGDES